MTLQLQYHVLEATPDPIRGERLNYGLVIFTPDGARVWIEPQAVTRLKTLSPDFARWNAEQEQDNLQTALNKQPVELQPSMLEMLCLKRIENKCFTFLDEGETIEQEAQELLQRMVRTPVAGLPKVGKPRAKKVSRLQGELRTWLKKSKAFSTNMEDLSKGRVVANYPISLAQDLYADFAVKNGKLHVIETMDLRGADKLTATLKGEAAIKGITLDEAVGAVDGQRIAIVRASDYSIAKPAILMIQRYASDVYEMDTIGDRTRLAEFFHKALHREDLLDLPN
jgi:hypothetical protein